MTDTTVAVLAWQLAEALADDDQLAAAQVIHDAHVAGSKVIVQATIDASADWVLRTHDKAGVPSCR